MVCQEAARVCVVGGKHRQRVYAAHERCACAAHQSAAPCGAFWIPHKAPCW